MNFHFPTIQSFVELTELGGNFFLSNTFLCVLCLEFIFLRFMVLTLCMINWIQLESVFCEKKKKNTGGKKNGE